MRTSIVRTPIQRRIGFTSAMAAHFPLIFGFGLLYEGRFLLGSSLLVIMLILVSLAVNLDREPIET